MDQNFISSAKIVQTNKETIYVIGGREKTLLARDYNIPRSCFKINTFTGEITQQANLVTGRCYSGLYNIGNQIYVVGGYAQNRELISSCEKYDMFLNKWTELSCNIPDSFSWGMAIEVLKMRYMYGFGEENELWNTENREVENFLRLDILKIEKSWKVLTL